MNELRLPCLYVENEELARDTSKYLLENILETVLDAKNLETLNGKNLVVSEEDLCHIVGCTLHGTPSLNAKEGIKELSTILIGVERLDKVKELLYSPNPGKFVAVSYNLRDVGCGFSGLITIEGLDDAKKAEILDLYRKEILDLYRKEKEKWGK